MSEKIPKIIHYVWVGPKTLTPLAERCITSWKKHLPDYEFRFWHEANIPMDHPYVRRMYAEKKWAFVSDYVRFWALEKEGGIYLDTDTEVLRSFEELREHPAFYGKTKDGVTAAGVIGAIPNHASIAAIVRVYDNLTETDHVYTSPQIVTRVLSENIYPDVTVYDYQYFNPCDDGEWCTSEKLKKAYTRNHWAESWVPYARLRKILRRLGIMSLLKKIL